MEIYVLALFLQCKIICIHNSMLTMIHSSCLPVILLHDHDLSKTSCLLIHPLGNKCSSHCKCTLYSTSDFILLIVCILEYDFCVYITSLHV